MPTSNGFTTPSMPAMAEPGSNRSLVSSLPSPAALPNPGSSKIGGSRVPTKIKAPVQAQRQIQTPIVGSRSLPSSKVPVPPQVAPKIQVNKGTQQQRMAAIQDYVSRLGSGKAESPAAFMQSIAHLF